MFVHIFRDVMTELLAGRLLGAQFCLNLTISPRIDSNNEFYSISGDENCLKITASSQQTANYALGRYIRTNELLLTPNNLEFVSFPLNSKNKPFHEINEHYPKAIRYYQNVCTESYSMAFWGWNRWEKELDWMAINGFSTSLMSVGQEIHFSKVSK